MFSFFRRKKAADPAPAPVSDAGLPVQDEAAAPVEPSPPAAPPPPVAVADASAALLPMESTNTIELIADSALPASAEAVFDSQTAPEPEAAPQAEAIASPSRGGWLDRLKNGLKKTGSSISTVFIGTQIDDALYEDLETALLMADAGVPATEFLLND